MEVTCGLFDGMVHYDAHWLVDIGHQSGDVATVELVRPHHFAGVALRPVDVVLKDGHTMRVLENLDEGELCCLLIKGTPYFTMSHI